MKDKTKNGTKGPARGAPPMKTQTIGLPVTGSADDQALLAHLDELVRIFGFKARTTMIRVLINAEWNRQARKTNPAAAAGKVKA